MTDRILSRQFHGSEGAEAWRVLPEGAYAFFRTDSFGASARFVDAIGGIVGAGDAPDIDIRGDGVTVLVRAFKGLEYGLVQRDLDLARAISGAAREIGLTPEPAAIQSLSIIPGATAQARDHAVLARGARLRPTAGQPGRGPGRPARTPGAVLVRGDGRVAGRWCGDRPSRRVGAVGPGGVAGGGRRCGGWPDRPSQSPRSTSGHSPIRPATRWTSRRRRRRIGPSERQVRGSGRQRASLSSDRSRLVRCGRDPQGAGDVVVHRPVVPETGDADERPGRRRAERLDGPRRRTAAALTAPDEHFGSSGAGAARRPRTAAARPSGSSPATIRAGSRSPAG